MVWLGLGLGLTWRNFFADTLVRVGVRVRVRVRVRVGVWVGVRVRRHTSRGVSARS